MNLIDLSIRRPIFICMITLFFIVLGLLAASTLPIDLYPNVSAPVVSVRVNYPGTAPEEIEQLVIKPLEDALSTIGGVKQLRSISREGVGDVSLEFEIGQDVDVQEAQIRAKLSETRSRLPSDIEEPSVYRQSLDDEPILELVVTGERTASELTDLAENLVALSLRQIEGVGDVSISGGRKQIVKVELLPHKMQALGRNASDVVAKIRASANSSPLGKLEGSRKVWILRVDSAIKRPFDLGSVVVGNARASKTPLLLKEVAIVSVGYEEPTRFNRFSSNGFSGTSVGVEVTRQSGVNTLNLAKKIKETLSVLDRELPDGVKLVVTADASRVIETNL